MTSDFDNNTRPPRVPLKRISVVERVFHETAGSAPTPFESRFSKNITLDAQAYSRKLDIGTELVRLDIGWTEKWEKIGHLIIENTAERFSRIPTEAQKRESASRILELYQAPEGFDQKTVLPYLFPPGESYRLLPSDHKNLWVRSQYGVANIVISILPG